jgi:putative endonuclease
MQEYRYFIYILANCSRHPLYTGISNSVGERHRQHVSPELWQDSYTSRYKLERLVYFERFQYVKNAIAGEKQIKRWSRVKKIALIERINPKWDDLSRTWQGLPNSLSESGKAQNQGPSTSPALRSGSARDDNSMDNV